MSDVPGVLDAGEDEPAESEASAPAAPEEKTSMRASEVVALVECALDRVFDDRNPTWISDSLLSRSHRAQVVRVLCSAISDLSDLVADLNEEPIPVLAGTPAPA
ncbi:hypothetical protein [Pseudonocardia sp. ICBG1142]|uniref:hypothetical protein n=1 Tax=Pseudonocardia sp. ICBG1142 TaxID=2846760 RepID=UPI001CF708A4|nr:hypothetical protein [Pseudonocardia sp. ICBG1142]